MAKQTIASSNMLPWHSCHWVRTAAYQTTAPFIKNVARRYGERHTQIF